MGSRTIDVRFELLHHLVHRDEMHLETIRCRSVRVYLQQTILYERLEVDADRPHVPNHLASRFFERDEQRPLAFLTSFLNELSTEGCLAGAGLSSDQDGAPFEVTLAT